MSKGQPARQGNRLESMPGGASLARMVERISDMPEGTLGFRSTGALTADDYRDTMIPPLHELVESGRPIRLLFEIGHDFQETPGGAWEDIKSGVALGIGHHSAWERMALVSDLAWTQHAVKLLGWMSPGELRAFPSSELEEAKRWVAAELHSAHALG
jgi:hypothetical protein